VDAVCQRLPAALAAVVRFAFITGWRVQSELLPPEWRQVDFGAGTVRLDAGTTKNGEARTFPMRRELQQLLTTQHVDYERRKKAGQLEPRVFVRMVAKGRRGPKSPKPIRAFTRHGKRHVRQRAAPAAFPMTCAGAQSERSSARPCPSASP
jgi:integrase